MPIPGARYRYAPGGKVRLAFEGDKVVEAKNMDTGATHTPSEFAADEAAKHEHTMRHARKHVAEHSTDHLGEHPMMKR